MVDSEDVLLMRRQRSAELLLILESDIPGIILTASTVT